MILREPKNLGIALDRGINVADFEDGECREIFIACLKAEKNDQPFDAFSLAPVMPQSFTMRLIELQENAPIAMQVAYFADAIVQASWRRRTFRDLSALAARFAGSDGDDFEALRAALVGVAELASIESKHKSGLYGAEVWISATETIEARLEASKTGTGFAVPTGIKHLDRVIHGLVPGRLHVLGARPKAGKTTFALNLAYASAKHGAPALFFTHEMTVGELALKYASRVANVSHDRMMTGRVTDDDVDRIVNQTRQNGNLPILLEHLVEPTLEGVLFRTKQRCRTHGIKVVVVDYVQQLHVTEQRFGNRQSELTHITARLKQLAVEQQVAVIAVAQINRKGAEGEEPEVHHLKDSGSLEQDADCVLLLWHDEESDLHLLNVAANRHGFTGRIKLKSSLGTNYFGDAEEERYANVAAFSR